MISVIKLSLSAGSVVQRRDHSSGKNGDDVSEKVLKEINLDFFNAF